MSLEVTTLQDIIEQLKQYKEELNAMALNLTSEIEVEQDLFNNSQTSPDDLTSNRDNQLELWILKRKRRAIEVSAKNIDNVIKPLATILKENL